MVETKMRHSRSVMSGPFKGHLAPKSSAFKPTVNKLSTQFLIQDHMSNHVDKILNAKCAIDAKPPKSYEKSVIKRDQVRRSMIEQQMREGRYNTGRNKYNEFGDSQKLHSTSFDDMRSIRSSTSSVSLSKYYKDQLSPRPATSNTLGYDRSSRNLTSQLDKTNEPLDVRKKTYEGGDYLDRHKDRFKNRENAPFTPRTKINNKGKSKLAESRHYAPPLKLNKPTKRISSLSVNSYHSRSSDSDSNDDQNMKTETYQSSRRNESEDEHLNRDVEKLNLSSLGRISSATRSRSPPLYARNSTFATNTSVYTRFRRSSAERRALERQLEEEERETKYLQFVNEVANEILTRGVYSDRVIIQTMERHIDRHRGELDDVRMRQMLIKLQKDLGIHVNYDYTSYQRESSSERLSATSSGGYRKTTTRTRNAYTKNHPKPMKRTSKPSSVRSSSDVDVARKANSVLVSDSDVASEMKSNQSHRVATSDNESLPKSTSMRSISSVHSSNNTAAQSHEQTTENQTVLKSTSLQSITSKQSQLDDQDKVTDELKVEDDSLLKNDNSLSNKDGDTAVSDASSHQSDVKHEESGSEYSEDDDF